MKLTRRAMLASAGVVVAGVAAGLPLPSSIGATPPASAPPAAAGIRVYKGTLTGAGLGLSVGDRFTVPGWAGEYVVTGEVNFQSVEFAAL